MWDLEIPMLQISIFYEKVIFKYEADNALNQAVASYCCDLGWTRM